jgi:hypothetical protein
MSTAEGLTLRLLQACPTSCKDVIGRVRILERHLDLPVERMRQTRRMTTGETLMGVSKESTTKGKESARGLKQAIMQEERKIEAAKGSDLKKGEERFEERSRSSDGKSAGAKQR